MNIKGYSLILIFLIGIIAFIGCEKMNIQEEVINKVSTPITVTLSDTVFMADGIKEVLVTIQINKDFKAEYREVSLSLTGGKFLTGTTPTTLKLTVNSDGTAWTSFQVNNVPGVHNISATIGTDKKYLDVQRFELLPLVASDLITLTADTAGVKANGLDEFTVTVSASKYPGKAFEITTSLGNIIGAAPDKKYTGQLDNSGTASVSVKTALLGNSYTLTVTLTDPALDLVNYITVVVAGVDPTTAMVITADTAGVRANGTDKFLITIAVAGQVGQNITLTASNGEFDGGAPHNYMVDASGIAQAWLKTEMFVTDYAIEAKLGTTLTSYKNIQVTDFDASSTMVITADTAGVRANGTDKFLITIAVPGQVGQNITLTSNNGEFDGSTPHNYMVDASGIAQAWLKTEMFVTDYAIEAKLGSTLTSYETIQVTDIDASSILNLTLTNTAGDLADNISTFEATADVSQINSNGEMVEFTVVNGAIVNGTAPLTTSVMLNNGTAQITIQTTDKAEPLSVFASITNPVVSASSTFQPGIAYPDQLQAIPDLWADDSSSFNISVTLLVDRTLGNVSRDRLITAEAYQMVGGSPIPLGAFNASPISTSTNETATVNFSAQSPVSSTPVILVFSTLSGPSTSISDTLAITVNP